MVDGQFAPLTDKIVAAIRKLSDQPIRFLVNTHVHSDHTGGNENFTKLGALIFGRDQLRLRLVNPSPTPDGRVPPSAPPKALPQVTYDAPVTLHINGEEVQLIPILAAHTDGDTLVRFLKHDVLAVGDYYRSIGYPFIDVFNGGTLEGLLTGLNETISLAGPKTKIIPGHGPIVDDPVTLIDQYLRHRAEREQQVLEALRQGCTSVEEVVARIYTGLEPALLRAAADSGLAHLIKLGDEGRVHEGNGRWELG
jgi:glyoxylase-like metal-dependent hydrolase (beta-lactamase superfamily II)